MVAGHLPATGATACHSDSVTNGMIGCASRSTASSTRTSVRRVARWRAASPFWICTLAISRYQSQNSFQTKSYRAVATLSSRYSSKPLATAASVFCRRLTIQRSAAERSAEVSPSAPQSKPSQFISTKRLAFQSLLQKLR